MPTRSKPAPSDEDPEDLTETAQFLQNLRLKVFVGFIATLMMLYSFFGSIYRIPLQMEQLEKEIVTLKQSDLTELKQEQGKQNLRIYEIEKILASKEDLFNEVIRTRSRVEAIERLEASRIAMQQQLDRLELVTKELAGLLDKTSTRLTELNANMSALKEASVETKKALEDIKRKTP